ncbi:complement component receptor 1-like protein [Protobothrops mucrosquamatus]|uniref:complement component receptor 1-like protein n=1 Tax=Protobothrops mucrosquamatus TaxID=103944 RepID=UPI00077587C5|nr:complement component receptor 1-like protein [Protobothrops mucrosquamatus]
MQFRPHSWRVRDSFFERKNKMNGSCTVMFGDFFSHLAPRILVLFSLFSGMLGDCGPPPVLKHAMPYDPVKSIYKPYESVTYKCLPGYTENHDKNHIATCFPEAGWNPMEEFCESGCEGPRETRFSVVDDEFLHFYPVGSVVHHICHRSAEHIPGHPKRLAITCLSDYTWSSVPVFCKGQSCGDPGKPENGDRIILMDFLLKARVNFTCSEGYQLIGSPTSQCLPRTLSNNTVIWKPKPPICFRPTCPPPPEIKNGAYTGGKNGTFPLNSKVTYICDLGFSLSRDDLLHCITEDNKTGIWRGSVPECKAQCPAPVLPPHSSLRGGGDLAESYAVATTLRLQCIPGYEYLPGTIPTMRCLDTSKWSDLPALCQGRRCPVPHIENGRILHSDDLRLGEEITLACDYGFRLISDNTRRCVLKSGKVDWNTELPFCERIPCVRPPVIANGRYDPNPLDTYDAGSTVLYRCDPDYSLIGKSAITCIVEENGLDGKWDLSPPECKKVECHRPRVENGRVASVFQATYTYENKIEIECNPGHTLVGSSTIECGADSQWKSVPTCLMLSTTSKPTKSPTPTVPPTPQIPPKPDTVSPREDGTEVSTTSKPTKSPTPTVPPTPQIPPRPGTVSPREDGTEETTASPTATTPTHESGSNNTVGIVFGAVIAVIVLAALIFAAVKWFSLQGKANVPHAPTDSYHVVSEKDMTLEEKRTKD